MLKIHGLSKGYGATPRREVLRDIELELRAGEYVAIVGESGSGKSTLLNLIAGIETPDAGQVEIDGASPFAADEGRRARLRSHKLGFVFQAFHLLPHLNVTQNVALPLTLQGVAANLAHERVAQMLGAVGLAERGGSFPRELSGGEMQRVAIARALVHCPRVLLADEPTGNLDARNAAQVLDLLRREVKRNNAAGILVTHSVRAAASADRSYTLADGELAPSARAAHAFASGGE
jgi:putative ABC transport system ATP-binding protein